MTEVIRYYKFHSSNENVENNVSRALKKILCGKKDQNKDDEDMAIGKARVNREKRVVKPYKDNSEGNAPFEETDVSSNSQKIEFKNSFFSILEQKCTKQYKGFFTKQCLSSTLDIIAMGTIEEISLFSDEICSDPYMTLSETRIIIDASLSLVTKSYLGKGSAESFKSMCLDHLQKNASAITASFNIFCTQTYDEASYYACGGLLRGPIQDILKLEKMLNAQGYGIELKKSERVFL